MHFSFPNALNSLYDNWHKKLLWVSVGCVHSVVLVGGMVFSMVFDLNNVRRFKQKKIDVNYHFVSSFPLPIFRSYQNGDFFFKRRLAKARGIAKNGRRLFCFLNFVSPLSIKLDIWDQLFFFWPPFLLNSSITHICRPLILEHFLKLNWSFQFWS